VGRRLVRRVTHRGKRASPPGRRAPTEQPRPVAFVPASSLRSILSRIGSPPPAPFRPDPFQLEALERVQNSDILVCAPTGAGKTWIAQEAIDRELLQGQRSWYASPLKALSNAKYEEFRLRFGADRVGILTGDRKENPDAPVVVGTTEILRNQLYDAMDQGRDLPLNLVVMDEAHYLNDPERGVVWEEVLIYLPVRVRLLLLSATVGNPQEICAWLRQIRGQPCEPVESLQRPVPLYALFLRPDGHLGLLMGRRGLQPHVVQYLQRAVEMGRGGRAFRDVEDVVEGLRPLDLLPAIFFLKSRADCDRAVESFARDPRSPADQEDAWSAIEPILRDFPILRRHRQFKNILRYGVASHHAGHLPQWKLLVERLMNMGRLDAIFSTSTVAAGVDFPARTVVVVQSDRFNGREFEPLTSTELQQMTGRAGRRGKDQVGFALFLPGIHQDIPGIARLLRSRPEPIRSRIQINSSMVLNLLLSHRPAEVRQLLERSLAVTQPLGEGEVRSQARGRMDLRGRERRSPRAGKEDHRVRARSRPGRAPSSSVAMLPLLEPGRLILLEDGSVHVILRVAERRGKPLCLTHRLGRRVRIRKGRVFARGIPVHQIQSVLEQREDLPPEGDAEGLRTALEGLDPSAVFRQPSLPWKVPDASAAEPEGELFADERESDGGFGWLWGDFRRHLAFLKQTGFVDEEGRLTADGRWASQLRLDHPIMVAESIRRGAFGDRSAPVLAGLVAPFVTDREREVLVEGDEVGEMTAAFHALVAAIHPMARMLSHYGLPTPILQFWPAASLYLWAKGVSWWDLRAAVAMDEGDLVSLIVRTADHLRQVCDLTETHPHLARAARLALRRIQREPAVFL
jgi:ATP-dependent RNA helicase HelY